MNAHLMAAGLIVLGSAALASPEPGRQWSVELESGAVWPARNVTRIPGDSGTWFRLNDLTGTGARTASRILLTKQIRAHEQVRLLLAPLSINGTGVPAGDIRFGDALFKAGTATDAQYTFNSYRLTWRRDAGTHGGWDLRWGATIKVRDARIALRQGATHSSDYDLGIVPLLHGSAEREIGRGLRLAIDLDALAAPQGRAEDLSIKLVHELPGGAWASIGYRTLEGGADNDNVHTFAWLNYMVASVGMRF